MPNFSDLLNPEYLWPEPGDRLFIEPEQNGNNAALVHDQWVRLVYMADGYQEAADKLVDAAAATSFSRPTLVYPIIFLYRHSIELWMKYILTTYGQNFNEKENWNSHDLSALWKSVERIVRKAGKETDDRGATDAVAACISELRQVDPGSFSFRYPVEKGGKPMVLAISEVDLAHLRRIVTKIHNFFRGLDGLLDKLSSA